MPLNVKQGGTWYRVPDGNFRTRWGGPWFLPGFVRIKRGPVGSGSWHDTGYRGPPGLPTNLRLYASNFEATHVIWDAPSSGPTATAYHIEKLDQNGTPIEGYIQAHNDRVFGTPRDTRWQYRVRAQSANGLWSDWVGGLRVGIGHPSDPVYGYVLRQRPWTPTFTVSGQAYRDNLAGLAVPEVCVIHAITWDLVCRNHFSSFLSRQPGFYEGGDRQIRVLLNEGYDAFGVLDWPSPLNATDFLGPYRGNGGRTGIICQNIGWSDHTDHRQVDGYITLHGNEDYWNYEHTGWTAAQDNYYW